MPNKRQYKLDAIAKIGTEEKTNLSIGTTLVNALIGNEENTGFGYFMKSIGKISFKFETKTEVDQLRIY